MASTDTDPALETEKKSFCQSFNEFLYNKENGTVMGRTGSSWGKIGLFYLVYYTCLAAFFAISLLIFYQTLDDEKPSLFGMESLLKGNPGLAFRPQPKIDSTLIKFEPGKFSTYEKHIASIEALLTKYSEQQKNFSTSYIDCSDPDSLAKVKSGKKVCKFDLDSLGKNCTKDNDYGYKDGMPCVLLKMNKVFGWEPKLIDSSPSADSEMQDFYKKLKAEKEYEDIVKNMDDDGVPVTCIGLGKEDTDLGEVLISPANGFLTRYFPYQNRKHYQAPLVMVQFRDLPNKKSVDIWCKAWAFNIKHHKNDKGGSTRFEIEKTN